ncbi:MAG: nucleotidyltransferase [Clostridiales bacterium]|nr:nucleotidyltransferase [Clostridiales bacterium]
MKKKPVLVIMAAGMGSSYGGLKQMDPIGPNGELIIDFSLYDAKRAGFESAVCIIKQEIEEDFKALMNRGAAKRMDIKYAYQELDDIPEGIEIPEGRVKPWGTSHAILAARDIIDGPFAVINADDYYGADAFKIVYDYLASAKDSDKYDYCMAAYKIENTLTEYGGVSRGICRMDEEGRLLGIEEAHKVQKSAGKIQYSRDDGKTLIEIPEGTPVSMNFFGFTKSLMKELRERERAELERIVRENPQKGEYLLPATVSSIIEEGKAELSVLECHERWYGVTYKEDRPEIVEAMKQKKLERLYPEDLWG